MQAGPLPSTDSQAARAASPAAVPDGKAYGRFYLWVALVVGPIMMFLIPVTQVPDEASHFWRAYQLCRKHVIGEYNAAEHTSGGHLPIALVLLAPMTERLFGNDSKLRAEEYKDDWTLRVDRDPAHRVYMEFHSYVVYSPAAYLPQMLGIKLAELFSDRLLALFYSARLCNLLVAALLTYLALRLAPCAHASIAVLALCPETFTQMCSASADALTNGCAILFFSLFLRAAVCSTPLRLPDYLALLAPLFVVTQVKFPYVFLALLMLAVPTTAYGAAWRRWAAVAAMGLICFAGYLGWYLAVRHLSMPGRQVPGIDVPAQLAFVAHHPWHFLRAFGTALIRYSEADYQRALGLFGWLDTPMPSSWYPAYGIFVLATFSLEALPASLTRLRGRAWAAGAFGLSLLMVHVFIYAYWNPVGYDDIEGFQGRYYLPLALALVPALNLHDSPGHQGAYPRFLFTKVVSGLGLLLAMTVIAIRFYSV